MATSNSPHHCGNSSALVHDMDVRVMAILPRDLNIVWGNDTRYWSIPHDIGPPAELHQVSWLEVTGVVERIDPGKSYEVGFRLSLNADAFGWESNPVYVMVKRGRRGKVAWTKIALNPHLNDLFEIKGASARQPEFNYDYYDDKIFFGLYEVWSGKWKGGLKIHGAFIREII